MADHEIAERQRIRGRILFTNFSLENPTALAIDEAIATARNIAPEKYKALVAELRAICPMRRLAVSNQVILAARSELAKRLVGTQATSGTINYGALGIGTTPVSDAETTLDAEVARALVATATQTDDTVGLDFYFSKASVSGNFGEFGTFIDGSASADTGLLFNRALTGGWTKTTLEAMTVSVQLSFNPA